MLLWISLWLLILGTSTLSGVLGMGGGLVLWIALRMGLSPAEAMVLHGILQAASNLSRAHFLRKHTLAKTLLPYVLGLGMVAWVLDRSQFALPAGLDLLLLGGLSLWGLSRTQVEPEGSPPGPVPTTLAGSGIGLAHLLLGVSGPLADLFFLRVSPRRHEVVATKAWTQGFSHMAKIAVFLPRLGGTLPSTLAPGFLGPALALSFLGSWLGKRLLERWSDQGFRQGARTWIAGVTILTLIQGTLEWTGIL